MGWSVMFERVGEGVAGFDVTGVGSSVPGWLVAVVAAFLVVAFVLAAVHDSFDRPGRSVMRIAVALMLIMPGWWALDDLNRRDVAAERRALEERAFELASRAFMPGSPLACLDPIVGARVEDGCEKSLFATPEATAAAVGYVAAQLSLLASTRDNRAPEHSNALASLRQSVEADRFGIVAHVLAVRDHCMQDRCAMFAYLQDIARVSANLAERPFEAYLEKHMANWPNAGSGQLANNPASNPLPSPAASAAPKAAPNNLYFPSSSSIPPINIMTAEPKTLPSPDTTRGAEPASPRKPASAAHPARQPPAAPASAESSAPMQLSPRAQ
jgi:hypothetical protein